MPTKKTKPKRRKARQVLVNESALRILIEAAKAVADAYDEGKIGPYRDTDDDEPDVMDILGDLKDAAYAFEADVELRKKLKSGAW